MKSIHLKLAKSNFMTCLRKYICILLGNLLLWFGMPLEPVWMAFVALLACKQPYVILWIRRLYHRRSLQALLFLIHQHWVLWNKIKKWQLIFLVSGNLFWELSINLPSWIFSRDISLKNCRKNRSQDLIFACFSFSSGRFMKSSSESSSSSESLDCLASLILGSSWTPSSEEQLTERGRFSSSFKNLSGANSSSGRMSGMMACNEN